MEFQAIGNWFLFVAKQWVDSLKVFLPNNLIPFVLVTLNAWLQAWKKVGMYFWWLLVAYFLVCSFKLPFLGKMQPFFLQIITLFAVFLFFCAIKPSVLQKNYRYFFGYLTHGLVFLLYLIFFWFFLVVMFIGPMLALLIKANYFNPQSPVAYLLNGFSLFFYFTNIFALFFFLENAPSITNCFDSIIRGIKMTFYGFPFCMIIGSIIYFISLFNLKYFTQLKLVNDLFSCLFVLFIYTLQLCILHTFYIKQVHEKYGVYFK